MITLSEIRRREIHIAALHRILLVQDAIVLAKWDRRQTRKPWRKPAGRMSAMRLLLIALALVVVGCFHPTPSPCIDLNSIDPHVQFRHCEKCALINQDAH